MGALDTDGRVFGPKLPKASVGQQPAIDHVNQQSAYARENTITGVIGGTLARGPAGTTIAVNQPSTWPHPWWVGVVNGKVRVYVGNVITSEDATTRVNKLSRVAYKKTDEAPFNLVKCTIANAKYEDSNQIWTFSHNTSQTYVVYVDGSDKTSPQLKYSSLADYNGSTPNVPQPSASVAIAITYKDGSVVQLVTGDIWGFSGIIDDFLHPFKVVDAGNGKIRVLRGTVYSYPNEKSWIDIKGEITGTSFNKYPNSIRWANNVPDVGGMFFDDDHNTFSAPSGAFDVYLKFERKNVKTGEPAGNFDYWTQPYGDFLGWECTLCVGSMPENSLEGNYYTDSREPSASPNYKPLSDNLNTVYGINASPPPPSVIWMQYRIKAFGLKLFSIGKQHYRIASVKKETITIPSEEQGGQPTIKSIYVATQNLRSDFFFYPPLDTCFTIYQTIPEAIGYGGYPPTILEPSAGE